MVVTLWIMTIDLSNGLVHGLDPYNGVLYGIICSSILGVTSNGTTTWPDGPLQRAMGDFESWLRAVTTVMRIMGPWVVSLSP